MIQSDKKKKKKQEGKLEKEHPGAKKWQESLLSTPGYWQGKNKSFLRELWKIEMPGVYTTCGCDIQMYV